MTKEEILDNINSFFNHEEYMYDALVAMDEYAEQECVLFALWLDMHRYEFDTMEEKELYQLYIQSKNKTP